MKYFSFLALLFSLHTQAYISSEDYEITNINNKHEVFLSFGHCQGQTPCQGIILKAFCRYEVDVLVPDDANIRPYMSLHHDSGIQVNWLGFLSTDPTPEGKRPYRLMARTKNAMIPNTQGELSIDCAKFSIDFQARGTVANPLPEVSVKAKSFGLNEQKGDFGLDFSRQVYLQPLDYDGQPEIIKSSSKLVAAEEIYGPRARGKVACVYENHVRAAHVQAGPLTASLPVTVEINPLSANSNIPSRMEMNQHYQKRSYDEVEGRQVVIIEQATRAYPQGSEMSCSHFEQQLKHNNEEVEKSTVTIRNFDGPV